MPTVRIKYLKSPRFVHFATLFLGITAAFHRVASENEFCINLKLSYWLELLPLFLNQVKFLLLVLKEHREIIIQSYCP